ncbi:MAG: 3-oxoacyl-(acyl-carrier-protein) reductase protein [Gammaproteobacteria bacterium]|jgi:meso-butanediol dehydrogenase/(S,S)-butanediol dehydrogenase/diacetyl reductase|nr:3-oxoacyl-(acyl-carrier-protein) reductase protein [Gammaproteobacteria bacterium]
MFSKQNSSQTQDRERAVISGATSGIGRATAIRIAARGAIVGILGRNASSAAEVADEVERAGGIAWIARTDVTDARSVEESISGFVSRFGRIDTAVASAGVAVAGTATDTSLDDWHRVIDTNLNGAFYLARCAIPELIKSRGTFTAISSDAGVQAACGFAAYCASKHGLQGLVKCLALDYGKYGVRSNAVCPAFVETPMADQLLKDVSPAELAYFKGLVPLARFAQPSEVAEIVAHLSSPEASYTNGLMYRLDGGSTAGYYLATS